jgi:phosphoglycolate phosphatase-like HAD superfamily hydrolase
MSNPEALKVTRAALFDVDGTLSDSFRLGFESTQRVLTQNGHRLISEEEYHQGTRYTTPARLCWHVTGVANEKSDIGIALGQQFDDMYVKLVSTDTAPLFSGITGDAVLFMLFIK